MRTFLILQCVLLSVGIGYAFNNERQVSGGEGEPRTFKKKKDWISSLFMKLSDLFGGGNSGYWGYEGEYGPSYWPSLFPDYCSGMKQSPIDITWTGNDPPTMTADPPLTFTGYDKVRTLALLNGEEQFTMDETNSGLPSNHDRWLFGLAHHAHGGYWGRRKKRQASISFLNNNGHTAQVSIDAKPGNGVLSGGPLQGSYSILQFHLHWGKDSTKGSEHTINGKEYPLELHIVHTKDGEDDPLNTPKGLAVTGFMFELADEDNAELLPLTNALKNVLDSDAELPLFETSGFRIDKLIAGVAPIGNDITPYSHYEGSLTTPTCNEVVEWINFLTPLKVSEAQLEKFREMMDSKGKNIVDNFRPPQPLNGREIEFYGPAASNP